MTVRIPRTGQIQLSGHISASFNQDSGSQTHMNNNAVTAACHNTSSWSPTQRSMNAAHGVITALTLNDRYTNTNYGTNTGTWPANTTTFNSIYNKQDTRPDGALYSNSGNRAPSVESYGTHGHQLNMRMYGSSAGAIYCQQHKRVIANGLETVPFRIDMSHGDGAQGWGTSSEAYLYSYEQGYLTGNRIDYISLQSLYLTTGTQTDSWTDTSGQGGIWMPYSYIVLGYRGFTQYPGYNFRGADLRVRPHYMRLIATSGYA